MPRMHGVTQAPPPRSWTAGRPAGTPRVIVIHYTAGAEGRSAAEDGAAYDRRRTDGTSCHFFTDPDSIVQQLDTSDQAHAALRNGNRIGIQVEQCGTVQTRAQWLDANSRPMVTNTARVCAWAMKAHGIPLVKLTPVQVRAGQRGICGHADITLAFPEDNGSHMDPGAAYPWDVLFDDIRDLLNPEDDMDLGDTIKAGMIGADVVSSFAAAGSPWADMSVARALALAQLRGLEAAKAVRAVGAAVKDYADADRADDTSDAAARAALAGKVDEILAELDAAGPGIDPAQLAQAIMAALPADLARQVVHELGTQLAAAE